MHILQQGREEHISPHEIAAAAMLSVKLIECRIYTQNTLADVIVTTGFDATVLIATELAVLKKIGARNLYAEDAAVDAQRLLTELRVLSPRDTQLLLQLLETVVATIAEDNANPMSDWISEGVQEIERQRHLSFGVSTYRGGPDIICTSRSRILRRIHRL